MVHSSKVHPGPNMTRTCGAQRGLPTHLPNLQNLPGAARHPQSTGSSHVPPSHPSAHTRACPHPSSPWSAEAKNTVVIPEPAAPGLWGRGSPNLENPGCAQVSFIREIYSLVLLAHHMQISFKIYKNLHKCKWVIRTEKVTGVGLTVQRLRMGLGRARMCSMLRKLLKTGSMFGSRFQGTAVGKEEEATCLPFWSGRHPLPPAPPLSSRIFPEPREPPQVLGVLMARQTAGGGPVSAHGSTQKYRAGSAGI